MPGRRTKGRGDRVEDLTTEQYTKAWELFSTGLDERTIKSVAGLSGAQLHALYTVGLPARGGRRKALPPFLTRIAEETAAVRSQTVEAAKEVSSRGVRVLRAAFVNAETAQTLISGVQRLVAERIAWAQTLPVDKRPSLDALMPGDLTIRALNAFRRIADGYERAARAYQLIYLKPDQIHPATRAVLAIPGKGKALTGGVASLPAALALADELMGEGTSDRIAEEVAREIMRWSPAQREHYALTGEEPAPSEIIDVNADERPTTDA